MAKRNAHRLRRTRAITAIPVPRLENVMGGIHDVFDWPFLADIDQTLPRMAMGIGRILRVLVVFSSLFLEQAQ
jgi:hypothetical protein